MNVAILAHGKFPGRAKTAVGILRYGDQDVRAVLDRDNAGSRVSDHLSGVTDAPIVPGIDAVPGIDNGGIDALVIGIAPIGAIPITRASIPPLSIPGTASIPGTIGASVTPER